MVVEKIEYSHWFSKGVKTELPVGHAEMVHKGPSGQIFLKVGRPSKTRKGAYVDQVAITHERRKGEKTVHLTGTGINKAISVIAIMQTIARPTPRDLWNELKGKRVHFISRPNNTTPQV